MDDEDEWINDEWHWWEILLLFGVWALCALLTARLMWMIVNP